jgi:hypothetical protein
MRPAVYTTNPGSSIFARPIFSFRTHAPAKFLGRDQAGYYLAVVDGTLWQLNRQGRPVPLESKRRFVVTN